MLMAEGKPPQTEQFHLLRVNPEVWAQTGGMTCRSQSRDSPSKTWACMRNRKEHPLCREALLGTASAIQGLIDQGLNRPGQSACNTSILPVKKPSGEYRMVQDLRAVSKAPRIYI